MIYFIVFILMLFTFVKPAHAYLDPGTGSYILQIIIGSLLAGGYFFREKLSTFVSFVKKIFKKK